MATVSIQCIYCNDYRIRCKGKSRACDKFPGKNENEQNKKDGAK